MTLPIVHIFTVQTNDPIRTNGIVAEIAAPGCSNYRLRLCDHNGHIIAHFAGPTILGWLYASRHELSDSAETK